MDSETQEIQYDNLRVHSTAADKLREVQRVYKERKRVSATQSELLELMADFYLAHELRAA